MSRPHQVSAAWKSEDCPPTHASFCLTRTSRGCSAHLWYQRTACAIIRVKDAVASLISSLPSGGWREACGIGIGSIVILIPQPSWPRVGSVAYAEYLLAAFHEFRTAFSGLVRALHGLPHQQGAHRLCWPIGWEKLAKKKVTSPLRRERKALPGSPAGWA